MDMSTLYFIPLKGQAIFSHGHVRVEMDCSSTTLIFKEPREPLSPSSIICVLSDTQGLLSLADTQATSKSYTAQGNGGDAPGCLVLMEVLLTPALIILWPEGNLNI